MLQSVLKNDPNYAEGYRLLGIAQVQLKQNAKACENFHKAKELGDEAADGLIAKHCK
jgi:cytochrome c-type biogenesis protein CcmH/NrfG